MPNSPFIISYNYKKIANFMRILDKDYPIFCTFYRFHQNDRTYNSFPSIFIKYVEFAYKDRFSLKFLNISTFKIEYTNF